MAMVQSSEEKRLELLGKTRALIEVERSLTATLEKVEPWLTNQTRRASSHGFGKRVRPVPTSMEQVEQILAVSRNLSSRTSAPAGWNPAAPVMGFSTPNPLPHQLRGGALAALQLERARQEERSQKRKRQEEEEQAKAKKTEENVKTKQPATNPDGKANPKSDAIKKVDNTTPARRTSRPQPQVLQTTMNLSDSSSEEEDSDSE